MGQLESYTIQDIYLTAIMSGLLFTYFAEEIEATIESIISYAYSANRVSRKRIKLFARKLPAGDIIGSMHFTQNLLGLTTVNFAAIEKPLDERTIWQDQFLNKWMGPANQKEIANLEDERNRND